MKGKSRDQTVQEAETLISQAGNHSNSDSDHDDDVDTDKTGECKVPLTLSECEL